jgi:ribosomal subunit interface protein
MQTPVKVAYHHVSPSPAVTDMVKEKVKKLEQFFDRITACEVTLEAPDRHHRQGRHFRVRIEMHVPGERLVVGRDPRDSRDHQDLHAAIQSAFREARRLLRDHADRFGHRVQARSAAAHLEPPRAVVARLFPQEGYGFLRAPDGHEIYFHEKSVLNGAFERLEVGDEVRYAEEPGDDGPQASTVTLVRRERHDAWAVSPRPAPGGVTAGPEER